MLVELGLFLVHRTLPENPLLKGYSKMKVEQTNKYTSTVIVTTASPYDSWHYSTKITRE